MSLIPCKDPACDQSFDTNFVCKDVTSLMGLRVMLESKLNDIPFGTDEHTHALNQLDYVRRQLSALKIENEEAHYQAFKAKAAGITAKTTAPGAKAPAAPTATKTLYLTCAKHHSYYYTIDC